MTDGMLIKLREDFPGDIMENLPANTGGPGFDP